MPPALAFRALFWAAAAIVSAAALPLHAQAPDDPPSPAPATPPSGSSHQFVTVTAAPQYGAGSLQRLLFGTNHRRLWTTPIRVEVLSLREYAGGLRPVRRGADMATSSLLLEAPDGRRFAFRGLTRDSSSHLHPELDSSIIHRVLTDQSGAEYPAAVFVVAPLLDAAGVWSPKPKLFVMPDDPALGEFRAEFGGKLGILEERPLPATGARSGLEGGTIATTDELYARLAGDPRERVDAPAFLTARLMGIYLGVPDDGDEQWKWLRRGERDQARWEPMPSDLDHALMRYDGLLSGVARHQGPGLATFGDQYPDLVAPGRMAPEIDRRLLGELAWSMWDSIAHTLQERLSDSVIDLAVRRLPAEYYAVDSARLTQALKVRRDKLPEVASRLYRSLASHAEVYTTDADETVQATRLAGGKLDVTVRAGAAETFHRQFTSRETDEVRLYLRGGDDTVRVEGTGEGPKLRLFADSGRKVVIDSAAGGWTRLYGSDPRLELEASGTHPPKVDRRPYIPPESTSTMRAAPREWGRTRSWHPAGGYSSEFGLILGAGTTITNYGFHQNPYASRIDVRAGFATRAGALLDVTGDIRRENSATHLLFRARVSGLDVPRFYGLGNETVATAPDSFYRVYQRSYLLSAAAGWSLGRHLAMQVGPLLRYFAPDLSHATLVSSVAPYGASDFGELGAELEATYDSRDLATAPTRGMLMTFGGRLFPALWNLASPYGEIHGSATGYLRPPLPLAPIVALRIGGERVWGNYPFQDAASIGGLTTVRGLHTGRYQGDAAAYGSIELRLPIARPNIFGPGQLGLLGLTDAGRVWLAGESSHVWHTAIGGGLWWAPFSRSNTFSATVARSEGRTQVYLRSGFTY